MLDLSLSHIWAADWSVKPPGRWVARAHRNDRGWFELSSPEPFADIQTMQGRIYRCAREGGILLGLDLPIGLPAAYASKAGFQSFREFFHGWVHGKYPNFGTPCERRQDIALARPFYPAGGFAKGTVKLEHLATSLIGNADTTLLRRHCEQPTAKRAYPASPLFWTTGAQQVGKAALDAWQTLIVPLYKADHTNPALLLWPFDGDLQTLSKNTSPLILAEIYPGEAYSHVGITGRAKRSQTARRQGGKQLIDWLSGKPVAVPDELRHEILDGFGDARRAEDRYDALVGLCGMLSVILGQRGEGQHPSPELQEVEGWILGQTDLPKEPIAQTR